MPFQPQPTVQYVYWNPLSVKSLIQLLTELNAVGVSSQKISIVLATESGEAKQWIPPAGQAVLVHAIRDLAQEVSLHVRSLSIPISSGNQKKGDVTYNALNRVVSIRGAFDNSEVIRSVVQRYLPPMALVDNRLIGKLAQDAEGAEDRLQEIKQMVSDLGKETVLLQEKSSLLSETINGASSETESARNTLESIATELHTYSSSSSAKEKLISEIHSRLVEVQEHSRNEAQRISDANRAIEEIHKGILSKESRIDAVHKNLGSYEDRLANHKEILKEIEASGIKRYEAWVEERSVEISRQENVAREYAEKAEALLKTANATRLNSSFESAARKGMALLVVLVFCILATTGGAACWIIWLTAKSIEATPGPLNASSLLLRYLSVSPVLLLDWFLIREFTALRRARQRYAYKSAVLLSIPEFERFASERQDDKLLSGIIEDVYKSPFEDEGSIADRKHLFSLLEKSIEEGGKVTAELVKTLKKSSPKEQ